MRGFASSDIHAAFRDIENAKKATKADAAFSMFRSGERTARGRDSAARNGSKSPMGATRR